jgi:hypothetical protein
LSWLVQLCLEHILTFTCRFACLRAHTKAGLPEAEVLEKPSVVATASSDAHASG